MFVHITVKANNGKVGKGIPVSTTSRDTCPDTCPLKGVECRPSVPESVASVNRRMIAFANEQGFTVNLSGNSPRHADALADLNIGPVTTILPEDQLSNCKTPAGRKVVVCPAARNKDITCAKCKLCADSKRTVIIGFPVHGTGKKKAASGQGGCYANYSHLGNHWRLVSDGVRTGDCDGSWSEFCATVAALPEGQLWRHNQAGDLPGENLEIDVLDLADLVDANKGRRGFTYTHKPVIAG